jgi:hypothetical protein
VSRRWAAGLALVLVLAVAGCGGGGAQASTEAPSGPGDSSQAEVESLSIPPGSFSIADAGNEFVVEESLDRYLRRHVPGARPTCRRIGGATSRDYYCFFAVPGEHGLRRWINFLVEPGSGAVKVSAAGTQEAPPGD